MSAEIQALELETLVREEGDTDWIVFNCEIDNQEELTNEVNETETKCGTKVNYRPAKGNLSGNATFDIEADGTATASLQDVRNWQLANTPLEMLIRNKAATINGVAYAVGAIQHHFYTGQFTSSVKTESLNEVTKFSWAFKPDSIDDDGSS